MPNSPIAALRAALVFALVGVIATFAAAAPAASAHAEDDTGGIGISITVDPPTPAPTPTSTTTTTVVTGGTPGSTGLSSTGGGTTTTTPVTSVGTVAPLDNQLSLGGVVFLSGLTSTYQPSINPLAGTVTTSFTVRNVSESVIDASSLFWIAGPVGNRLGASTVKVAALAPGETRVVTASIPGAGQWGVLTTKMTFTPPKVVDGVALVPVTRDAMFFAAPWAVSVIVLLGGASAAVVMLLSRVRVPRLAGVPA